MLFRVLLTILGLLLLATLFFLHRRLRGSLVRRGSSRRLAHYPSVTVIRPVKGLDSEAKENIRAAFDHGYPGWVEILFVFDDPSEAALPLVDRELLRRRWEGFRPNCRVLFSGQPPAGRTGKLNAMIAGLKEARGELIAFADSDIRPDRQALKRLVETLLGTPRAGSAFAPVYHSSSARTIGDAGHSVLLNALYGPDAAASARQNGGELPFIMGQFMLFTREALEAIGGLECADGQLVDDMYLGMRVKAAGFRNMVSPHPVPIIQYGASLKQFFSTFVRWITFSRSGLPEFEFKAAVYLRGAVFWLGLVGAFLALGQGCWIAAALSGLANLGVLISSYILHKTIGGEKRPLLHCAMTFFILLISPLVLLLTLLKKEISWRGRSYRLDNHARLADLRSSNPNLSLSSRG